MITINNIMAAPGLEDLAVMAGRNGLDREVRTVTVLDAPDGPKWLKGNELILSSAYLFENNSQLLKEYVSDLINVGASGFGIKMGRFVDGIPKEVAALADQWDFPILKIPYKLVWTDVIAPFYQLRYGLEEAPLPARIEPEAIGPIVEAGKLGPRRLMSCLSRLFALPMLLAAKDGEITEDNGLDGADKLMQLSRDSAYFPENAGKEIARLGEFYVLSYQVPVRRKDQPKYLIVGGGSREALRELGRLFELLTVLVGDGGAERQDEDCLYRYFLTRLVGGRLSREDIAAFEKDRGLKGSVYSGILLITGEDYQEVYSQLTAAVKRLDSKNGAALPPRLLYDPAAREAVVLLEYQSVKERLNINSWLRGAVLSLDDPPAGKDGDLAASNMYPSLEKIGQCYQEARDAKRLGRLLWKNQRKHIYAGLSFFALLQHKDLAQIDLRDIVLLKQSNSQLSFDGIETVETYLECANYKTAAKRLYIHENTLRYRVQKISDLLNLNLENPVAGHSVLIGIKIWKLRSHSDTASDPMGDNAV